MYVGVPFLHQFFTPNVFYNIFYTNFFLFLHQFLPKNRFLNFKIWCKNNWCKKRKNFGVKQIGVKKPKILANKIGVKNQKFWRKKNGVNKLM